MRRSPPAKLGAAGAAGALCAGGDTVMLKVCVYGSLPDLPWAILALTLRIPADSGVMSAPFMDACIALSVATDQTIAVSVASSGSTLTPDRSMTAPGTAVPGTPVISRTGTWLAAMVRVKSLVKSSPSALPFLTAPVMTAVPALSGVKMLSTRPLGSAVRPGSFTDHSMVLLLASAGDTVALDKSIAAPLTPPEGTPVISVTGTWPAAMVRVKSLV